jgi:hypothetical protein
MSGTTERPTDEATPPATPIEGDIREFRKAAALWRKPRAEALREVDTNSRNDMPVESVNSLVRRVADQSAVEIEKLIAELQGTREILRSEGERIQRELLSYADMSQTAMTSMKIIGESLAQWKASIGTTRSNGS